MSSELSEEKTIQDQIEALLDLLPTLTTELRFAGCGDNAPISNRIKQACSELKRIQEA
ncbi:hypothetical protein [Shewanella canadensis]|uniref:hypothetical protein n=1 Tax=Shewanella canadensis TaxID=271096 RepID=UPI00163B55CE|nr:hypothetical protein [Shewanella canadensis]